MASYTQWFIYTGGDTYTNKALSNLLEGCDISKDVLCSDGVPRNMWFCKIFPIVKEIMKAKESDGRLKVQIFVKQGPDDVPHYWGLQVKSPHGHQAARQRLKDVLSQRRHAAAAV